MYYNNIFFRTLLKLRRPQICGGGEQTQAHKDLDIMFLGHRREYMAEKRRAAADGTKTSVPEECKIEAESWLKTRIEHHKKNFVRG